MLAVSDDSDPNGQWYYHSINSMVNIPDPTTPGVLIPHWADYPGLAVDEEVIYVTGNMFEFGATGAPNGNRLWITDKGIGRGGLYEGGKGVTAIHDPSTLLGVDMTVDSARFRNMQPAHVFGTAPAGVGLG